MDDQERSELRWNEKITGLAVLLGALLAATAPIVVFVQSMSPVSIIVGAALLTVGIYLVVAGAVLARRQRIVFADRCILINSLLWPLSGVGHAIGGYRSYSTGVRRIVLNPRTAETQRVEISTRFCRYPNDAVEVLARWLQGQGIGKSLD